MNVIKGGWVGQTFALAKVNESGGGRKTRIRRSKEERKTMVESFIKKYQKLNNGSFPSVSLTHKEVGGSFYTVREIVREIIQENRVLGPAKLTSNDTTNFAEQYPLGSISIEPQIDVELSNETHTLTHGEPDQYQDVSEELTINSSGEYDELHQHTVGGGNIVNKTTEEIHRKEESVTNIDAEISLEGEKDVEKKETEDLILEAHNQRLESGTIVNGHTVETERNELEESMAKTTQMKTEIFVETFPPLKTDEKKTDKIGLDLGSVLTDEKVEANIADSLSEIILVDDKSDTSFECLNSSTAKESLHVDVSHGIYLDSKADAPGENQSMNAPTGVCSENLNGTITRGSHGPSISKEMTENNMKTDIQLHHEPTKLHDPTLDRINLESWEATSKKSGRTETNPLFETIKALIVAFVKFWSE